MASVDLALRHDAARGAGTAADARLRFAGDALIGIRVNDDGRAVGIEHGQRTIAERHAIGGRLQRRLAAGVGKQVRQIAHVVRVIHIGVSRAVGTGIEMTSSAREPRCFALADRMQMQAVRTRLQAGHGDRDLHGFHTRHELHVVGTGHGFHFTQFRGAADAVAFDLGVRPHTLRRFGRRGHSKQSSRSNGNGGSSNESA